MFLTENETAYEYLAQSYIVSLSLYQYHYLHISLITFSSAVI